jgi:hypothetical protein
MKNFITDRLRSVDKKTVGKKIDETEGFLLLHGLLLGALLLVQLIAPDGEESEEKS